MNIPKTLPPYASGRTERSGGTTPKSPGKLKAKPACSNKEEQAGTLSAYILRRLLLVIPTLLRDDDHQLCADPVRSRWADRTSSWRKLFRVRETRIQNIDRQQKIGRRALMRPTAQETVM